MGVGFAEPRKSHETRAALSSLLESVAHLSQSDRGAAMLEIAAELIETAAYELAGHETSPRVARLILMSAEVARVAGSVRDEPVRYGLELRPAC